MPKSIDSLVDDIYALLDEDTHHEPSEENLEWLANAVQNLLRSRLSSRERKAAALRFLKLRTTRPTAVVRSTLPSKAERMLPKTYFKFLYGDMIELLLLFLTKEANMTFKENKQQVEVAGVIGHCDAVIDGVTVDVKSASPYSVTESLSRVRSLRMTRSVM
jgi:uncharacterized protein YejL (UPF0352 family)